MQQPQMEAQEVPSEYEEKLCNFEGHPVQPALGVPISVVELD